MTKISLTPVIDVVFILLIFFMLASNFNKVGQLEMNVSKESSQASDLDIKTFKVLVRQDETVISNGKIYDDKELITMLKIALKDSEEYAVVLTAKKDVTYQRYLTMMNFLKENNIENISIGIRDNEANKKRKREYEDDGLLPLVNIIFLLLIFFMIVGVIEKSIIKDDLSLPKVELDKFNNDDTTKIFFDKNKNLYIDEEKINIKDISSKIKSLKSKEIILVADESILIDEINNILLELKKNKINTIKLLTSLNAN